MTNIKIIISSVILFLLVIGGVSCLGSNSHERNELPEKATCNGPALRKCIDVGMYGYNSVIIMSHIQGCIRKHCPR